ncbi:permease prefix domain 1-containing protein [Luteipulveratus halotolerans]|uniref:permease prefix domain 1-containing protein n=1 Tax=Luteipulveratus halotolerans TaxID=1631356 RepID=UPI000681CEA2|nr:permease prefix domain 1-containing protein [Luteipulveratus halotolerans]
MTTIDAYVRDLARASGGRRSVIVTEARDHLHDSADAWQQRGLDRAAAEQRAIDEFGPVSDLAPGYRSVIALSAMRRTTLLVLLTVGVQPVVWAAHASVATGGNGTAALDLASVLIGWGAIAVSVAGLALCSVGVRRLGVRAWIVPVIAAASGVVALAAIGLGIAWMVVAQGTGTGVLLSLLAIDLPMTVVLACAIRSWRQVTLLRA